MTSASSPSTNPRYAIPEKTLDRWARQRLQCAPIDGGGRRYSFALSGSTCSNMGLPIEIAMTVECDAAGRIQAAFLAPAAGDAGAQAMCAAAVAPGEFLARSARCEEAVGLTLAEAAFRDWDVEVSGCLCTAGNRRHKWRNAFQTLHYAQAHSTSSP